MKAPAIKKLHTTSDLILKFTSVFYGWRRRYPEEFEGFLEDIKKMRQTLYRPNAMSKGGTLLLKASVPRRIVYVLNNPDAREWTKFPKNWMDDPHYMNAFWQAGRAFCVNEKSIPTIRTQDRKDIEDFD